MFLLFGAPIKVPPSIRLLATNVRHREGLQKAAVRDQLHMPTLRLACMNRAPGGPASAVEQQAIRNTLAGIHDARRWAAEGNLGITLAQLLRANSRCRLRPYRMH